MLLRLLGLHVHMPTFPIRTRNQNLTTDSACLDTVSEQDEIAGHILQRMATYVSRFLKRSTNAGTVKVTGKRVNRGAGYGLEIPCIYTFNVDTGTSIP